MLYVEERTGGALPLLRGANWRGMVDDMTREYKITEQRPVYKRVAIGSEYVPRPKTAVTAPAPDRVDAHAQHVWRQVIKTSGGDVPELPAPEPEPEPAYDPYAHISGGMYG